MKGFNRDMERYLSGRKDKKVSFRFGKKVRTEKVPEVKDNEMTIEERGPSLWARLFGGAPKPINEDLSPEEQAKLEAMEQDIEAVEEAEATSTDAEEIELLEEAREGMLARFFQTFRFFERRHRVDDEAMAVMEAEEELAQKEAEMDADVKDVLKIAHTWLGKLTKRHREAFMESDDYQRYVAVLEKYGVAKKK